MKYFIANWKMYFSYQQAISWLEKYKESLKDISHHKLIIAPSYEALSPISSILKDYPISLAGQDCSSYDTGAHTGQVSAQSLYEIGCTYCIIGHYETRKELYQSDEMVAQKINLLQKNNIQPILCIGDKKDNVNILKKQLSILRGLSNLYFPFIAYEPIWAIGTGKTPSINQLNKIFSMIEHEVKNYTQHDFQLFYGGSINAKNAEDFFKLPKLAGLLIGKASTDFQEFKNIVCFI